MNNNLVEIFSKTALKFSKKIAIDDDKVKLSFLDLDVLSNKYATLIRNKENLRKKPICVYLPKSTYCIVAFLGIIKTGNFYIPLDVKSPLDRITKIIETLNSDLIITNEEFSRKLLDIGYKGKIICIESANDLNLTKDQQNDLFLLKDSIIDLDPIYSIFTSGSTGTPKGVLISHRGVLDYISWAIEVYKVTDEEIIGNQAPFYFDNSTLDIYLMLVTGAKLVIITEEKFSFPIKLIEFVNEQSINFVFWVPSVLNSVSNFDVFRSILPTTLNKILFAGEVMSNKHLNYWRKNYPLALYSNLYGPTEITVDCTYYIVDREFKDDESLPIGKACKNTEIMILTEQNVLAKKNELGELCVRGSSLAFGYYNDWEKTKTAFVQNPLNQFYPDIIYKTGDLVFENEKGEIIFVGRKDSQIKHMGYRIELGEIETAILGVNGVKNTCVLYDSINKQIVAFYISDINHIEIRKQLSQTLPKYMIPTRWLNENAFPFNSNGKIDRIELAKKI
jgi:D-alanine--poly(phosphoribitol) ligase subunit 1